MLRDLLRRLFRRRPAPPPPQATATVRFDDVPWDADRVARFLEEHRDAVAAAVAKCARAGGPERPQPPTS
jgi:hypothetical protein